MAESMAAEAYDFGEQTDEPQLQRFIDEARRQGGAKRAALIPNREVFGAPWPAIPATFGEHKWRALVAEAKADGVRLQLQESD